MPQPKKALLWQELKAYAEAGLEVPELSDKPYVTYSEAELQTAVDRYKTGDTVVEPPEDEDDLILDESTFFESAVEAATVPDEEPEPFSLTPMGDLVVEKEPVEVTLDPSILAAIQALQAQASSTPLDPAGAPDGHPIPPAPGLESGAPAATPGVPLSRQEAEQIVREDHTRWGDVSPSQLATILGVPWSDRPSQHDERAGVRYRTHDGRTQPLRVDFLGRVWMQEEVQKPAIPKKRMRRIEKYTAQEVETKSTYDESGRLLETFEIAGEIPKEVEVRISLPTSQVGVYRDPRFPFLIHQYAGQRAFDYDEIRDYYGDLNLIPQECLTIYIGSDLCFEMNSVRRTIEREYREKVLGRSTY